MHSPSNSDQRPSLHTSAPTPLSRNPDYMRITLASTVSSTGSKVSQFALPFLALGLTQSPLWAGLLGAAQLLPYLFFSLPAGAWVDRTDRRRLLIRCDILRAGVAVTIPLAYLSSALTIAHVALVVFVIGICSMLFEIADLASLPHIVAPAQLGRARAISEGIDATTAVVGPSLGGMLVGFGRSTLSGSILASLADSASYLLSALALLGVRRPLQAQAPAQRSALGAAMLEGLRFLWQATPLRLLMLLTATINFLQAPISLFVILIAQRRFDLSPSMIGVLFGVAGGAAAVGSLFAAWWYRPERLRLIVVCSLWIWVLASIILAAAPGPWALALGLALNNSVWPFYAVAVVSYRLATTPDRLQGRVISGFRMVSYGAESLGLALGGLIVTMVDPSRILSGIAVSLLGCALVIVSRGRQDAAYH